MIVGAVAAGTEYMVTVVVQIEVFFSIIRDTDPLITILLHGTWQHHGRMSILAAVNLVLGVPGTQIGVR